MAFYGFIFKESIIDCNLSPKVAIVNCVFFKEGMVVGPRMREFHILKKQ